MMHEHELHKNPAVTKHDLAVAAHILDRCKYYRIRKVTTEWLGGVDRHAINKVKTEYKLLSTEPE